MADKIVCYVIKSGIRTLPVLALSTAETELIAVVRGTAEAMGLRSLFADLDRDFKLVMWSQQLHSALRRGLASVRYAI